MSIKVTARRLEEEFSAPQVTEAAAEVRNSAETIREAVNDILPLVEEVTYRISRYQHAPRKLEEALNSAKVLRAFASMLERAANEMES